MVCAIGWCNQCQLIAILWFTDGRIARKTFDLIRLKPMRGKKEFLQKLVGALLNGEYCNNL